ncbi:1293_t:CDS:1, partial [Dentiscutata erythropus]
SPPKDDKLNKKDKSDNKSDDKLDKPDDKLDKKDDILDKKPDKLDNNNIKKLLLRYLREFSQGKFNGSLDDDNLLDRMINSSTELSDTQKIEYQKIRRSISNMYKDEERDHYFVDPDDQEYISVFLNTSKATFED